MLAQEERGSARQLHRHGALLLGLAARATVWRPRRWSRLESASSECERRWENHRPHRLGDDWRSLYPRAKKVLELSLRGALQLGHNYIGTEHMLLGLVREGEGVGAQVLVSLGADLSRVRHQLIQLLSGDRSPEAAGAVGVSSTEPRAGRLSGLPGAARWPRGLPSAPGAARGRGRGVRAHRCGLRALLGVRIAHIPVGEIGERMVPRLVTRSSAQFPRAGLSHRRLRPAWPCRLAGVPPPRRPHSELSLLKTGLRSSVSATTTPTRRRPGRLPQQKHRPFPQPLSRRRRLEHRGSGSA